jgi:uncharacterized protein (DUF983 family)
MRVYGCPRCDEEWLHDGSEKMCDLCGAKLTWYEIPDFECAEEGEDEA